MFTTRQRELFKEFIQENMSIEELKHKRFELIEDAIAHREKMDNAQAAADMVAQELNRRRR